MAAAETFPASDEENQEPSGGQYVYDEVFVMRSLEENLTVMYRDGKLIIGGEEENFSGWSLNLVFRLDI